MNDHAPCGNFGRFAWLLAIGVIGECLRRKENEQNDEWSQHILSRFGCMFAD
jgi:hypothetical protein